MNEPLVCLYVWLLYISLCFHVTVCGFIGLTVLLCRAAVVCDFTGFSCGLILLYYNPAGYSHGCHVYLECKPNSCSGPGTRRLMQWRINTFFRHVLCFMFCIFTLFGNKWWRGPKAKVMHEVLLKFYNFLLLSFAD